MVGVSHQRLQRPMVCKGCGVRTMCVSKDGGQTFYCNRCGPLAVRSYLYNDSELAKTPEAPYNMYGDKKNKEPVKPKTETEALQEMETLVKKGMDPKLARGKIFNESNIITEKNEKPKRTRKKITKEKTI